MLPCLWQSSGNKVCPDTFFLSCLLRLSQRFCQHGFWPYIILDSSGQLGSVFFCSGMFWGGRELVREAIISPSFLLSMAWNVYTSLVPKDFSLNPHLSAHDTWSDLGHISIFWSEISMFWVIGTVQTPLDYCLIGVELRLTLLCRSKMLCLLTSLPQTLLRPLTTDCRTKPHAADGLLVLLYLHDVLAYQDPAIGIAIHQAYTEYLVYTRNRKLFWNFYLLEDFYSRVLVSIFWSLRVQNEKVWLC